MTELVTLKKLERGGRIKLSINLSNSQKRTAWGSGNGNITV